MIEFVPRSMTSQLSSLRDSDVLSVRSGNIRININTTLSREFMNTTTVGIKTNALRHTRMPEMYVCRQLVVIYSMHHEGKSS